MFQVNNITEDFFKKSRLRLINTKPRKNKNGLQITRQARITRYIVWVVAHEIVRHGGVISTHLKQQRHVVRMAQVERLTIVSRQ